MRVFTWGAVVFSALIALQGIGGGYANAAGEIHFLIKVGGTEQEVDVSAPDTKLNLKASYTVGGVTIKFTPISGSNAYIDLNEAEEWLVLKNVKISSASVLNEVKFTFWREFSAPPSGAGVTYHIQAGGLFKRVNAAGANGAMVSIRGSIEEGGNSLGVIQNRTLPPPIVCPSPEPTTRCITGGSYTIGWTTAQDSSLFTLNADTAVKHVLKAMFWVTTVQANNADYLQLNNTATSGIQIGGGPPSGAGGTVDACEKCKKEECDTCLIEGRRCKHVRPANE